MVCDQNEEASFVNISFLASLPRALGVLCFFGSIGLNYASQDTPAFDFTVHYDPDTSYKPPSMEDFETAKSLFRSLLTHGQSALDPQTWHRFGFVQTLSADHTYVIIKECQNHRTGKGLYLIRHKASHNVLVQAPHYPSDLLTGDIAACMFRDLSIKAVAWSTTHRQVVDLAHADGSYFNAFTEAFAEYAPQAIVVQLHAFSQKKHETDADLIVSSALETPPDSFKTRVFSLNKVFKDHYRLYAYPEQISFLGGVKNANARCFYRAGGTLFLHLEMSKKFRNDLLREKTRRQALLMSILK